MAIIDARRNKFMNYDFCVTSRFFFLADIEKKLRSNDILDVDVKR